MQHEQDTIVAIATPPGRGGIGVVRLSGPAAKEIAEPLLRLRHTLEAGRARFGEVLDASTGEVLDEAVVTFFAGPHSYTGDDVVEIAVHGSPVLLDELLRRCVAGGARLAEPGEFTERAFLAGRLDLTQAEAVDDLIASRTLEQARVAARQLGGALANAVRPAKQRLVDLIAGLEAGIDFAEDDIDLMGGEQIEAQIGEITLPLAMLERSFAYGRMMREGLRVALVGRPNAGKSSLFNRLLQQERAIVTDLPGTTRDVIAERLSLAGVPVELLDTAGLREAPAGGEAEPERLGIARSREALADAELVLLVADATREPDAEDMSILRAAGRGGVLLVLNKSDLVGEGQKAQFTEAGAREAGYEGPVLGVSATTGEGIEGLREALEEAVRGGISAADGGVLVTTVRQHAAIAEALTALAAAQRAVEGALPHEMLLLDLHGALHALDGLTGATTTEEILRLIFGRFCIGK